MSRKRSLVGKRGSPPVPATQRRVSWRRSRFALIVVLALSIAGAGLFVLRTRRLPQPPNVKTTGFEPIIAAQIEKALVELRAAPRSGQRWGQLGLVLQAHGFTAEARFCFAQAERFEPREPRWPYFHGLLLRQDDVASALARLGKAADLAGEHPDAPRLALAELNLETGRFDEAERHFKKLLASDARHAAARLGLAKLSRSRGQMRGARQWLEPCLTNSRTAGRARTLLSQIERELGNGAAAADPVRPAAPAILHGGWPDPFSDEAAQLPHRTEGLERPGAATPQ